MKGVNLTQGFFYDEYPLDEAISVTDNQPLEPVKVSRDLASYPAEVQAEVNRRLAYLTWVEKRLDGGWTQARLEPLLDQASIELGIEPPNWRTLVRWRTKYSNSEFALSSLIPKYGNKGNRITKSDSRAEKFYEQALKRFLVQERPSVAAVYRFYADSIRIANQELIERPIKALSYSGFYNRIKMLPAYDVTVARHGKFIADTKFNMIGTHIPPKRVLERVEIDHTPLDLILLDDELDIPLGRPCLTVLIDSYSHCITGFYIGFEGPSFNSVRKALLNAIKPKAYVHKKYPAIENDWLCSGKPETLVVDNGAEFWSQSLELVCLELGINVQYNPVRKPWLKPMIERLFGSINSSLLTNIPGKTFSNLLKKEEYHPNKDAIMHFSTFVEHFHQWVIDLYHQNADSRKRYIPALSWKKGYEYLPPAQVADEDLCKLEVIIGLASQRQLRRGGIHIYNLRYDSEELSSYRKNYAYEKQSPKVLIKINPDDISSIYVFLDKLKKYLQVPCVDRVGYTHELSLQQHFINCRLHKSFIDSALDLDSLARVRMKLHERIKQEVAELKSIGTKRKSQSSMSRLAKHQQVGSGEKGTVIEQPLPRELSKPKSEKDNLINQIDEWDDYVSEFDGY
ncbi:Mu transposase C-terminal domain-containing protein [Oceanisphaera pacifica]|uniref:Transposase n=1 Tax=Oceanisphaera pacifica TaxID=2818389 RepID=A0ABS3NG84_9GAMM|nr:Mu transposase C-terminal domain-containing protein [Oceanisphaera pacifica]MBO1519393.1 transposase [Oceanisphaera pacifica]